MTKQLPMILGVGAAAGLAWWFFLRPQAAPPRGVWQQPIIGPGTGRPPVIPRPDLARPGQPPQFGVRLPVPDFLLPGHIPRLPTGGSPFGWDGWVEAPVLE